MVWDALEYLRCSVGGTAAICLAELVRFLWTTEPEVGQFDIVVDIQKYVFTFQVP